MTVALSFCLMVLGLVGLATPAQASAPVVLSGTAWFSGNGVNVCTNANGGGSDPLCGGESQIGNVHGAYWQCVELAQRFYKKQGWHSGSFGVSYAYQIYDQAPTLSMSRQANGSISAITRGDMIIHGADEPYSQGAGHVSIVESINGSTVTAVQQNAPTPTTTYSLSGGTLSKAGSGTIRGIVHDPANSSGSGSASSSQLPRIASVGSGVLNVKEGPLNAVWSQVGGGTQVKLSPNRIASLNSNGELYVKEGSLNAPWVMVSTGVDAFDVTDNRVGILAGGVLSIKEGPLNAAWSPIGSGSAFKMSPNRIALYDQGNNLVIKEGPLNATWHGVAGAVDAFDVTDNRVGILAGGVLSIKQGALNATWSAVGGGVAFKLSPNRIASLNGSGELYIKEGALNAPWSMVSNGVNAFDVTDNRVGMLAGDHLSVKEGALNVPWSLISDGVVSFDMS